MDAKTEKAIELVKKFVPEYKIINKQNSRLHRAIGWILSKIGNKTYMTNYLTTIGTTTAVSATSLTDSHLWQSILHEGMHAIDSKCVGNVKFGLAYLFPQILGFIIPLFTIIGLLLGASAWILWGLVALLFLAPIPAIFRTWIELRGYTVTLAVMFWSEGIDKVEGAAIVDSLVNIFTGPGYYYMWPFRKMLQWYFDKKLVELRQGTLPLDAYLVCCRNLCMKIKSQTS